MANEYNYIYHIYIYSTHVTMDSRKHCSLNLTVIPMLQVDHLYYVDFEGSIPRSKPTPATVVPREKERFRGPMALFRCSITLQMWPRHDEK